MTKSVSGRLIVAIATLSVTSAVVVAQPAVVTSQAALIAGGNGTPTPYTNDFSGTFTVGNAVTSIPFTSPGGAFTYTYDSPGGSYRSGVATGQFLGTSSSNTTFTFNFTSGNVTGVGARFFHTDITDAFQSVPVKIDFVLSDASTFSYPEYTPGTPSDYRGFLFNQPGSPVITSMTITAPGAGFYAGLDDLTVLTATPVPEPTLTLAGIAGVTAIGAAIRRRRTKVLA